MVTPSFDIPDWIDTLIQKYYSPDSRVYDIYFTHVVKVTELALKVLEHRSDLKMNREIVIAGGMLHDIGIIQTNAPEIDCHGPHPYIAHTYLGREMLENEGYPEIAPMCERHVGVGLSKEDIIQSNFPLPQRDMLPITLEEKLICYADKFYSKSPRHLTEPKPPEKIRKKVLKYGKDKAERFEELLVLFGLH